VAEIDSLTLDVGLTSEEFQEGVNKILNSMTRMESQATETGESMGASFAALGSSVASLAWRFAGMFLAFRSIEGLVDYFKDLSRELADLGFAARYLGQSGIELRRFGEVAELAGGQSQDAISAVRGLESAIFGLEFKGQMSENLLMLQRLGVGYLTLQGQMRPVKEIAMETAAALERQLPGDANRAMRVQWAAQIFGPGGLANAIGGGVAELGKFYRESVADNKKINDRLIARQMELQQSLTRLTDQVKGEAAAILDRLWPSIMNLIETIENDLIPTLDELITDIMDWLHPDRMLEAASNGPMGITHPINDLAHLGSWIGGEVADYMNLYRKNKLAGVQIPSQVTARLGSGVNLDALKLLHWQVGGDKEDPTWSKAITAYRGLRSFPNGPAGYVAEVMRTGNTDVAEALRAVKVPPPKPSDLHYFVPSTPSAPRPLPPPSGSSPPTSSTVGPRIQIDSIGPIITQATDANGLMADINRAAQRKLLVAQSDPGLA